MSLPKLDKPIYRVELESTQRTIKYRPFLVKEEKIMALAAATEDPKEIELAIRQVINNCVLEDIDINSLPMFDLENIFLHLRMKSVGEIATISLSGIKDSDCESCKKVREIEIPLEEIKIIKTPGHDKNIKLDGNIGIIMKYPTGNLRIDLNTNEMDLVIDIIAACIETIYDGSEQYDITQYEPKEIKEFIEQLNRQQFKQIETFFNTMPKLSYELNVSCSECGHTETHVISGLQSFFG